MRVKMILKCNRCGALAFQERDLYKHWNESSPLHPTVGEWGKYKGTGFILDDIHRCDDKTVGTVVFVGYDIIDAGVWHDQKPDV